MIAIHCSYLPSHINLQCKLDTVLTINTVLCQKISGYNPDTMHTQWLQYTPDTQQATPVTHKLLGTTHITKFRAKLPCCQHHIYMYADMQMFVSAKT